jgi:hypothetical protein
MRLQADLRRPNLRSSRHRLLPILYPFSGDFSYNIPLMDVDGYPINIAYNSGGGMDDEASWTGYGWNINPGSISRNMKGIPDDFNGSDLIVKEYNIKPDITGGIGFNASAEIFGLDGLGANASADIFYNNKRGLGVEIGAGISATLSSAKHTAGEYTTGLSAGANLGITSNSQTGADFNFGASLGVSAKDKENCTGSLGLRFGGSLNSRAGLKSTTLGASFNTSKKESDKDAEIRKAKEGKSFMNSGSSNTSTSLGSVTTSYGMAFTPTITMPMTNESYSIAPQAGPEFWGFQVPTIQLTAHYTKQKLAASRKEFPAYGFLYSVKGRTDANALLDFNREKDVPYMESTPTLSVPYVTEDIFTATSHLGSSQFKAFSNSSGVFFDSRGENTSTAFSLGVEFGAGGGVKGGADFSGSGSSTITKKWTGNNDFLQAGDFSAATGQDGEDAYFKLVGEKSSINKEYLNRLQDRTPVKIKTANVDDQAKAFSTLAANNAEYAVSSKIARNKREPRGEIFQPLKAADAAKFALNKAIPNYAPAAASGGLSCSNGVYGSIAGNIDRVGGSRKAHHLSEIKVIKNDGMRLVYGVPVYNNKQVDITMSVEGTPDANNQIHYADGQDNTVNNRKGADYYFSKETIPSYATNFLLSGICSPDYVDVTGNGISDDDLGSAVKFNYSRVNTSYKWRTPSGTGSNYANFSEGNKSQTDDDKASYSYGDKELWYSHSIESKNMIAVFRLSDRDDGVGYNPNGSRDNSSRQKKLDRIDLYTKAELQSNPSNPTPIKSVHFEYDYSLFEGVPNNINGGGKLTLKSLYFTYGKSMSGAENRYHFTYNESGRFQYQQYDRWGTYKDKAWNKAIAGVDLNNNDFPYSVQDQAKADEAVKKWQLSQIELPSGGKIKVEYESDDYAFVQNQRAMQMAEIVGYGHYDPNNTSANFKDYRESDKIYIRLPAASADQTVVQDYFEGVDQLYFKTMIKLVTDGSGNELVSGFAKIKETNGVKNIRVVKDASNEYKVAEVTLEKRGNYHPIAAAGWQYLRTNIPKLAYPYSVNEDLAPLAFVKALIAAIRNVGELLTPFEQKAMRQGFASEIIPEKGFARILTKYKKLGGGLRVRKILMDDIWSEMVTPQNGRSTTTGMLFEYTCKHKNADNSEINISSGVASYEPMAGGEENPFRQPISYQQKAHLTSSLYTVEEPLGESYFPAPSVGYSQVTVKNLDAEGAVVSNGYSLKKFFTAKDFPTIARRTDLSKDKYNQSSIFGLFNIDQGNSVVLSQGFYVETNDMHGQAASDETFDGSGKLLSGAYYHYKSSGTEQLALDNNVLTLQPDGTVKNETVGEEFEMYHDMREQITDNMGINLNVNLDVLYFVLFVVPVPTFIPIMQSSHSAYEAASTIKVVSKYAIPDKVVTIENGSTMTSENVLWDALTGQVLMTKTQNGFDDPVYNFTLPAYLVNEYEKGMGAAYKNTGIVFNAMNVVNGTVPAAMANYLVPGDELGVSGTENTVWAMEVPGGTLKLINKDGSMYTGSGNIMLLRSGRRNMIGSSTYSVVSLKNPIRNGRIQIDKGTDVLSTSAGTFSDEWSAETRNTSCINWAQNGRQAVSAKAGAQFPVMVSELMANQKRTAPAKSNLSRPVPVSQLMHMQKKAGTIQPSKIVQLDQLIKASKGKSSAVVEKGLGSSLPGPGDPTDCDPCPDNLSAFEFTDVTLPGTFDQTVTQISYKCNPALFPANKKVVFVFTRQCGPTGANLKTGTVSSGLMQTFTAEIDKDHLTTTIGIGTFTCHSPVSVSCHCENIACDPCNDLSAYTITTDAEYGGDCVKIKYNCPVPMPAGKTVYFKFSNTCNGTTKMVTAALSSSHPEAEVCGLGCERGDNFDPVLTDWYCADTDECSPCSPSAYYIETSLGSGLDGCGKIHVNVSYTCATPFPPGVTAKLSFSYMCNGAVCSTKAIEINSGHLTGTVCLLEQGISCAGCSTDVSAVRLDGISGCNAAPGCCPVPVDQKINPYYTGLKGNWRGKQSYVYRTDRNPKIDPQNNAHLPTNTRKGGVFKEFTSFYKAENGKFVPKYQADNKWVASATVTKVNGKGQEVENKDALGKYSSAQFGFNELVTTAVGGNARNTEIGYDGFEDYNYSNNCNPAANSDLCSEDGHFNFKKSLRVANGTGITLSDRIAHTGNYSVFVAGGVADAFTRRALKYDMIDQPKYAFNASEEMILKQGGTIESFQPLLGKKYIISGWIKGDVAFDNDPDLLSKARIQVEGWNGSSVSAYYTVTAVKAGPKVEGWTRVMASFEIPGQITGTRGDYIKIILLPGTAGAYFDDIRIHPYDGNMKSFAYDYKTFRLMAELDENNYATFFEYDDEGQLLRNKKETEKGIVTLKETRSRVRKNN